MKYWKAYKNVKLKTLIECKESIPKREDVKDKEERLKAINYHIEWREQEIKLNK